MEFKFHLHFSMTQPVAPTIWDTAAMQATAMQVIDRSDFAQFLHSPRAIEIYHQGWPWV
jgi:hypothetical protein